MRLPFNLLPFGILLLFCSTILLADELEPLELEGGEAQPSTTTPHEDVKSTSTTSKEGPTTHTPTTLAHTGTTKTPEHEGSTTKLVTDKTNPAAASTTGAAHASTPAGGGSTVTTTTTPVPTGPPEGFTTLHWTVPMSDTDPTLLLQHMAALQNEVNRMASDLQTLYNNVNPTGDDNYIVQLQQLNKTINTVTNASDSLSADINATIANFTSVQNIAQPLVETISCFRYSFCSRYTGSPTPAPCPAAIQLANSTHQTFKYSSNNTIDCPVVLRSVDNNYVYVTLNVNITGAAYVDVRDAVTNAVLVNITASGAQNVTSTATALSVDLKSADDEAFLSVAVEYWTANPCDGHTCKNNGTCTVQVNGPTCLCKGCWSGDDCGTEKPHPCDGSQAKRKCKEPCQCVDDPATCTTWTCNCPTTTVAAEESHWQQWLKPLEHDAY